MMKTASVNQVAAYSGKIRKALNKVSTQLGPIQIGNTRQFPNGCGKAAKGRTVWRIVEEAINQNLKKRRLEDDRLSGKTPYELPIP